MACTEVCPSVALQSAAHPMSPDEILNIVRRDEAFYDVIGGMTLSGGEPLCQPEACIELLQKAKGAGINTAVETSGYFDGKFIPHLANVTDLFLWDYKDGDNERHNKNTGVSNSKILDNLFLLDNYDVKIVLRCIMIKGVNMDEVNINAIAQTFHALKHCIQVDLLPYHPFGSSKNEQLGLPDNGIKEWVPSSDEIKQIRSALVSRGVNLGDH